VWKKEAYQQQKNLFDYDDVLNKQQKYCFTKRDKFWRCTNSEEHFAYGEQKFYRVLRENVNKQVILLIENLFGRT
jgi:preprotein translocase subunit SecA